MRELLGSVYGAMPPRFGEERRLRPLSVYASTKAFGEVQTDLVLRPAGISYSVVRYFSVYGQPQVIKPGSHSWVVAWFAARAAAGLPLHLNGGGHQVRDFVHVDDIAEGTLRALTPRYVLRGPATGPLASGPGMTVSPCRRHDLGGGVTGSGGVRRRR
ncbi:NAD-dependent epimerase/dehydratase family protein [Streptomyces ardesiacus]|uniref:NAD-dependent epimerase/dehydratase family protein n=1 Tax=Streptomyces ardesiacus TaxID=285564 RepID=UPI003819AB3D